MIRRRQGPVFHQYSQLLIGAIAILGILDTAYLTWVKLSHNGVCGTKDCETVLSSPFANIGNLPLTGLGLLSYIAVAVMSKLSICNKNLTDIQINSFIDR
jgi:uncharacterized membrane protein